MTTNGTYGGLNKMLSLLLSACVGALITSGGYQILWASKLAAAESAATHNREGIGQIISLVTETVKQNNQLIAYLEANK